MKNDNIYWITKLQMSTAYVPQHSLEASAFSSQYQPRVLSVVKTPLWLIGVWLSPPATRFVNITADGHSCHICRIFSCITVRVLQWYAESSLEYYCTTRSSEWSIGNVNVNRHRSPQLSVLLLKLTRSVYWPHGQSSLISLRCTHRVGLQ